MNSPRYSMSFTTGALLYRESLVIVELYAQLADWKAVRDQVLAGNLLQMRTPMLPSAPIARWFHA